MRFLLHHDILQQYLNNDPNTKPVIEQLLQTKQVYLSAHALAVFAHSHQAEMTQLMRHCRLAKTPSYIPTEAILNNTHDTLSQYAALAVDAWVVSDTMTGKHVFTVKTIVERLADKAVTPIPFINLKQQYHDMQPEMEQAIDGVLNSSQFIMGQALGKFEHNLSHFCGAKHAIACGSGTDAIMLVLMAIDMQPGDEVITTCFSFIATAEIPALMKATLKFVDIDETTYNIDVSKIAAQITDKTRVIMPVSLYGQPADMPAINELAAHYSKKFGHKIYVIEDAAQSFGATYHGRHSCNLSDMATASFFPAKPLGAYGDAGAVLTDDDKLAKKIRTLLFHGQTARYHHDYIGFNGRCDTLQAAITDVKLKYLAAEINTREQVAQRYHDGLKGLEVITPFIAKNTTSAWAQYSLRVQNRQQFQDYLQQHKIPTAVHYPKPLHLQPCFASFGFKAGDFPVAEKISNEIVSLPMSPYLSEQEQNYITHHIKQFFKNN